MFRRYRARVRVLDLGPLAVEEDGVPVPLAGGRLWAVLAVLAVHARTAVSADRIVGAVWGDEPPARPGAALDSLLWRLRRTLEPGRPPRAGNGVVRTTDHGYVLAVPDDAIDSRQFVTEAGAADAALARGDPGAALRAADAALDRWRGRPFDGVPDDGWLEPERERLRQARSALAETRGQALLQLGRPEQAAADAAVLLTEHPYRERLWGQRILGLYRAGRQADALAAYEQARRLLSDDLGVDPGPELAALQAAVLAQDPTLRPSSPPITVRGRGSREIPLHGRDVDLAAVGDLVRVERLVTVAGPMGVGKTALATTVAARSGNAAFVDLTAVTDDSGLLGALASTLGFPATAPDAAIVGRLRAARLLLVLDNCEQILPEVAELVADLLAAAPGVRVLATSREPLDVPGEQVHRLAPLLDGPAAALFTERAGRDLDATENAADLIAGICADVGGLPLGIELAARRARAFGLEEVADSVRADPGGLTRDPRSGRLDRTLGAAIEASHRLLTTSEQHVHQRLSVLAGPFTALAAAAALDQPASTTLDLLAALAHRSLLVAEPRLQRPTRFRQLIPLRTDARQRLAATGAAEAATRRRATWATDLLRDAPRRGRPGQRDFYDRLDDDWASLALTVDAELEGGGPVGARLAVAVQAFCYDRNRTPQGLAWLARAVAVDLDDGARAAVRTAYGGVLTLSRRSDLGRAHLKAGVPVLLQAADAELADAAGVLVDAAAACWVGDEYAQAEALARHARELAERAGSRYEADVAEAVEAAAASFTGDPDTAHRRALDLLDSGRIADNGLAQLFVFATAGIAAIGVDPAAGLRWTEAALRVSERIGARNLGRLLEQRAGHLLGAGRPDDAVRCLAASAAHARALGEPWPGHPGTEHMIMTLRKALPADRHRDAVAAGERIVAEHGIDPADWL